MPHTAGRFDRRRELGKLWVTGDTGQGGAGGGGDIDCMRERGWKQTTSILDIERDVGTKEEKGEERERTLLRPASCPSTHTGSAGVPDTHGSLSHLFWSQVLWQAGEPWACPQGRRPPFPGLTLWAPSDPPHGEPVSRLA